MSGGGWWKLRLVPGGSVEGSISVMLLDVHGKLWKKTRTVAASEMLESSSSYMAKGPDPPISREDGARSGADTKRGMNRGRDPETLRV